MNTVYPNTVKLVQCTFMQLILIPNVQITTLGSFVMAARKVIALLLDHQSASIKCTHAYLALIPVFILAGILLVVFLIVLNLTVATGTINGLVFYANIVQASQGSFGVSAYGNRITSVFIAWLNLDFGFETCLYNGLDVYTKTFLQFLLPVYIWVLVAVIIVSSHYSTTMARLSERNAVPVLATLFLLSYVKIIRAIIVTFSFTLMYRENNSSLVAWFYDGKIQFLRGKHLILFYIFAIFISLHHPSNAADTICSLPSKDRTLQNSEDHGTTETITGLVPRPIQRWLPVLDWGDAGGADCPPSRICNECIRNHTLCHHPRDLLGSSCDPARIRRCYKDMILTGLQCFYVYNLVQFASWSLFNRYNSSGRPLIKQQQVTIHTMIGMTAFVFAITILYHVYDKLKRNSQSSPILTRFLDKVKRKNKAPESGTSGSTQDSEPRVLRAPTFSVVSIGEPCRSDRNV